MAIVVQDPFQALTAGAPGPPLTGWTFNGGSGVVRAGNGVPSGPYPEHHWYEINTPGLFTYDYAPGSALANVTVWMSFALEHIGPFGDFLQLYGNPAVGSSKVRILTLHQESDGTLSAYVAGSPDVLIANSGGIPFSAQLSDGGATQRWYYMQLNVQIDSVMIGPTTFLRVTVDLAIDSTSILSGVGISNFVQASSFAHLGSNYVSFIGNNLGIGETFVGDLVAIPNYPQGIWTITVTNPGSGYNPVTTIVTFSGGSGGYGESATAEVHPVTGAIDGILFYPGAGWTIQPAVTITDTGGGGSGATAVAALVPPAFIRIPQAVNEVAKEPTDSMVRIPQAVNELAKRPTTSHVRIPQMVIELATPFSGTSRQPIPEYVRRRAY